MALNFRLEGWQKAVKRLDEIARLTGPNMNAAQLDAALVLRDGMRKKIYEGDPTWPPNAPVTINVKGSSKPLVGNGDLARAIRYRRIAGLGVAVGVFHGERTDGVDLATIARSQEFGITILPKNVKMLAMPVNKRAARAQRQFGSARNIPDLVHPKGSRIIGKPIGKRRFEIWFVLLPKVKIPARSFVFSTQRELRGRIRDIYMAGAAATMNGQRYARKQSEAVA